MALSKAGIALQFEICEAIKEGESDLTVDRMLDDIANSGLITDSEYSEIYHNVIITYQYYHGGF